MPLLHHLLRFHHFQHLFVFSALIGCHLRYNWHFVTICLFVIATSRFSFTFSLPSNALRHRVHIASSKAHHVPPVYRACRLYCSLRALAKATCPAQCSLQRPAANHFTPHATKLITHPVSTHLMLHHHLVTLQPGSSFHVSQSTPSSFIDHYSTRGPHLSETAAFTHSGTFIPC